MYKIALVCQHGASTGMCVAKMRQVAQERGLECEIAAYSDTQMENLVEDKDVILLGPQLGFKKNTFQSNFPDFAHRIDVIDAMDFGMMNGDKILDFAIDLINSEPTL